MRWRPHETIEKSLRLLGFELDGQGVYAREWSGFRGKADIGVVSNALRCLKAANALMSTQGEYTKSKPARENIKDFNVSKREPQILPLRPILS
jgi:hypothetical protein